MKISKLKSKKPLTKKEKNKLFSTFFKAICLLLMILAMIIGFSFASSNFNYNLGIAYNGGYIFDVGVKNSLDPSGSVDLNKSLFYLRNKLDPLGTSDTYIVTSEQKGSSFDPSNPNYSLNHLKVVTSNVNSVKTIEENINRLGAVYFLDSNGADILQKTAASTSSQGTRTPLNSIFSGVNVKTNKNHQPTIQFSLADGTNSASTFQTAIKKIKSGPVYIWTDLANFINNIRNNADAVKTVSADLIKLNNQKGVDGSSFHSLFDYSYTNSNGQKINGNFLNNQSDLNDTSLYNKILNYKNFKWIKNVSDFEINPNDKNSGSNIYIDSFRFDLLNLYSSLVKSNKSKLVNEFKNYLIDNLDASSNNKFNFSDYTIVLPTLTTANLIDSLITPELSSIQYTTNSYAVLPPSINKNLLTTTVIILIIIAILLAVYLLVYYRLFGFIAIMTLALSIILTLYFSSLLNVTISPQSIATVITLFIVGYESIILLFSRYKHERYTNLLPFSSAMKVANRQTITIIFNILVILAIIGLSFFWEGTSNLKTFGNVFLIGILLLFLFVFLIGQVFYWLIAKLKLMEKYSWLDFPNWSLIKIINNKRVAKNKKPLFNSFLKITKFNSWSATEIIESGGDSLQLGNTKDNLINNKQVKLSLWKKIIHSFNLKNFKIWSPVIIFSIILIAFLLAITGSANINNSIQNGTDFKINNNPGTVLVDVKTIKNTLNSAKKNKSEFSKIDYKVYEFFSLNESNGNQSLSYILVETNISSNRVSGDLVQYLNSKLNLPDSDKIVLLNTKPLMENDILRLTIICLAISLGFILLYTIFILDWAQFLAIFASSIFTLVLTVAIAIIFHLMFSYELITSFILVFVLSIIFATVLMSKIKQNKKVLTEDQYNTFFNYIFENYQQKKQIRNEPKIFYKNEIQKILLANPNLSSKEAKKQFKLKVKKLKLEKKLYKKENKVKIQKIKKEFKVYDNNHNLIKKISNIIILQLIKNMFILIFIGGILFIPFAILSSDLVGIGLVAFFGIIIGIYISITLGVKIWTIIERYRTINKIKIKNYLDSQRIDIDEQKVIGVNS